MRILVCGSRSWNDPGPIARELEKAVHVPGVEAAQVTVIHGAARGADSIAGNVAHEFGYQVIACPADWNRFGRAAGPIRNQQMLKDHQPELVLAFAADLSTSTGTAHMVQIARKAGVPVHHFSA